MRKIFIAFVLMNLFLKGNTQTTSLKPQLTSVKQLMDINKDNIYYEALKNLVELYHVTGTEEVRQDYKYYPDEPLIHRSFAIVMVTALDKIRERFDHLAVKLPEHTRDSLFLKFTKKHFRGYSDSAVIPLPGYAQYKDVDNDDIDHESVKRLTNFYRIKLGDTENTFSPDKPMTDRELNRIFIDYFGERSIVTRASSANATRGKWANYLNTLMERMYEYVKDLASSD